jgi:hypothetical protein
MQLRRRKDPSRAPARHEPASGSFATGEPVSLLPPVGCRPRVGVGSARQPHSVDLAFRFVLWPRPPPPRRTPARQPPLYIR